MCYGDRRLLMYAVLWHCQVGCLERRLMESYSPPELAATLRQLSDLQPGRPLWRSNTRWQLPIPVQSVIMSLPAGFARDYFYIVMAKANELLQLKVGS